MKRIFLGSILLSLSVSILSAERETYVGLSGYWVDNNTDSAPGGALRIGWHFPSEAEYRISTDVEIEAAYWDITSEAKYGALKGKADTKYIPVLANLRVNVPLADTGLLLYGGGGLGVSYVDVDGTGPLGGRVNDSGAVFSYGFFVGIGGRVTEQMEVRVGYRSLWISDDTFNDGTVDVKIESERNDIFEVALRVTL